MIIRPKEPQGLVRVGALWTWERIDPKTGLVLDVKQSYNIVPTQGLNHILNVILNSGTQITSWYVLLVSAYSNNLPGTLDTYAAPNFTEFQSYNEANRQAITPSAGAALGVISNSGSRATFTITIESELYGSALVGGGGAANTKGDTAGGGTLLSSVAMGTPSIYSIGEIVRVTITLTIVSA